MVKTGIKRRGRAGLELILFTPWIIPVAIVSAMVWIGRMGEKLDNSDTLAWLVNKTTLPPPRH